MPGCVRKQMVGFNLCLTPGGPQISFAFPFVPLAVSSFNVLTHGDLYGWQCILTAFIPSFYTT